MRRQSVIIILLGSSLILLTLNTNIVSSSEVNSIDYIHFNSGTTMYSPLNKTYYSNSLVLNLTFGAGLGVSFSLNYSIDGKHKGSIPLVAKFPDELHMVNMMTGLVRLPELSDGSHFITINVLCSLNKPRSPDYTTNYIHNIYFTIETTLPELPDSENWVEVDRFIGGSWIGGTRLFIIDHNDWRIRWNCEPPIDIGLETPIFFRFNVLDSKDGHIKLIDADQKTNGSIYLFQTGAFYLYIMGLNIDNYTIIIEQNTNSIPEFPSWTILPISIVSMFVVIVLRKRFQGRKI